MSDSDQKRLEQERRFWKAAAEGYDDWICEDFDEQYRKKWNVLRKYIQQDHLVCDVGCGPGDLTMRVGSLCKEVQAIDATPEMIELAQGKDGTHGTTNVHFQVADAYHLPFDSNTFDTVMSVNALQTMKEPKMALLEMGRVLKPDGQLLLITYCYGDSSLTENIGLIKWAVKYRTISVWQSFKLVQLKKMFHDNGLKVRTAGRIWTHPVVAFLRATPIKA